METDAKKVASGDSCGYTGLRRGVKRGNPGSKDTMRSFRDFAIFWGCSVALSAQAPAHYAGPIFDVHLHTDPPVSVTGAPNPVSGAPAARSHLELRDAVIDACNRYNITRAVLNGEPDTLRLWDQQDHQRFLLAPMILLDGPKPVLSPEQVRALASSGQAAVLGELMTQYFGLDPSDPVLEPYWKLAESLDLPVMIHSGTSFSGTPYKGYPAFRLRLGNPLLLEDVLVAHPKLRLWIAHGGQPWTEETFALMSQYSQVYMDISTIDWIGGPEGRPAFYAFLSEAIQRGFGKRIMFGSDEMAWPDAIGLAVQAVDSAPFLSSSQKADIFYNNAMTFFRLKQKTADHDSTTTKGGR
jgi:hypothetical protein